MRKAWFVYQMGAKYPVPAIIYDDLPNEKNFLSPTILQKHELGIDISRDNDGEVLAGFNYLSQLYPYMGDVYAKPAEVINLDVMDELVTVIDQAFGPAELR